VIRPARPDDREAIVALTDAAFEGSEEALRVVRELEPEISLVWEDEAAIVGHVMLTRMTLLREPVAPTPLHEHRPFQLSPLSVAPSHQRRGIGSALTREALRLADDAGEPLVLVLGHPTYYPRFGFEPAAALGLESPREYGDAWMAAKLSAYDPSIRGKVVFPAAFG
jgi:putative acetyltransferase